MVPGWEPTGNTVVTALPETLSEPIFLTLTAVNLRGSQGYLYVCQECFGVGRDTEISVRVSSSIRNEGTEAVDRE